MCGILIHRKEFIPEFNIDHRGIKTRSMEFPGIDYVFNHASLPLQTMSKVEDNYLQPFKIDENNYILFNGEIFNFKKFGQYKSDLDYLVSFFRDGFNEKKMLQEINRWDGFWSIVLVNVHSGKCILFTDPLGKKQLYYTADGVCSEIRPLTRKGDYKRDYDESNFGTSVTPFFYVKRLMPNCIYSWDMKEALCPGSMINQYFNLKTGSIKSDIPGMMDESIKARLINKMDSVTLFLSGGLDSTIILYHLLQRGIKPECLSIENGEDEKYIKIVEKFFKIKSKRIKVNKKLLRAAVECYEHPIDYGSLLPQYCLCKEASNRVLFSGDGADELFGGYTRCLTDDTQQYDVFKELPYYHHVRLDRVSMAWTKELRSPFLSTDLIRFALSLPWEQRRGKNILREAYRGLIPKEIIERKKLPLRMDGKKDNNIKSIFYDK